MALGNKYNCVCVYIYMECGGRDIEKIVTKRNCFQVWVEDKRNKVSVRSLEITYTLNNAQKLKNATKI